MKVHYIIPRSLAISSLLLFFLSTPDIGSAQNTVAKGIVLDPDGNPVEDAQITFYSADRGFRFTVKSDKEGNFIKVGIIPAVYKVSVEMEGYFTIESITRIRFGYTEEMKIKLRKIPPTVEDDNNLDRGIEEYSKGNYDEAIKLFKEVITKFPTSIEGYYNLGLSYLRKDNLDQALVLFEKAKLLNPEAYAVYLALGEGYFKKGDNKSAIAAYTKASEIEPENSRAYYNLGMTLYKQNDTEAALMAFGKCIELDPQKPTPYYQAGLVALKTGDYEKSIGYFEKFLKIEPEAKEAAQVQAILNELKKAIKKD
jgi:tetratricopeptide (TPR) repeat protein